MSDAAPHLERTPYVAEPRLRVRYAETDQMKVVYHSNYIIWFEVGRVELMRSLGFAYRDLEAEGFQLPVVEVRCRYKQPARYDDEIMIRTHIAQQRSTLMRFAYEVIRIGDGALLAEGESTHMVLGPGSKITPLPEKYLTQFRKAAAV